jgi:hemolysin D
MPIFAGNRKSKATDQHDFRPILAEIQERPPNPAGRMFLWVLMAFLVIAGLGLFLIEVDVVVSARGKIIPAGDVKTLQPLETGVVSGILVKEGDYVARGATLVEIDPALDTADLEGKEKNLRFSRAASQRIDAVLAEQPFRPNGDTEPELAQAQRRLYETQRALYRSTLSEKEKALREAEASLQGLREERKRLESLHRLVSEEEKRQQSLVKIGALAENRYRDKVKERLQTEKELELKGAQVEEGTWKVQRVREEMETFRNSFREKLLAELSGNLQGRNTLESEVNSIHFRKQKRQIAAPVNGTVHQLHVKTVGGVVTPAQPVVSIVPENTPIVANILVVNRDIGYVRQGQECIVKVDTYDFQKHGTVEGRVETVSPFNVENKENTSDGYPVFVNLAAMELKTKDGAVFPLRPGMAVTTEINVGKRRVIEFFLFPIIKYLDEGLKVR